MEQGLKRFPEIDRLRAVAILMVVFHHLCGSPFGILAPFFPSQLTETWTGVDLFFVISGFVVYRSMARSGLFAGARPASSPAVVLAFYQRRFRRIAPLGLTWLFLPILWLGVCKPRMVTAEFTYALKEAASILTLTYNYLFSPTGKATFLFSPFWSLCVEEHFYLLLPLLLLLLPSRRALLAFCLFVFALVPLVLRPLFFTLLDPAVPHLFFRCVTHSRIDSLLLGVLLGELTRTARAAAPGSLAQTVAMNILGSLCIGVLAVTPNAIQSEWTNNLVLSLNALLAGTVVYLASRDQGWILNLPGFRRLLGAIGKRSYALYLCHLPAYYFTFWIFSASGRDLPAMERFELGGVYLLLLAFLASASYRWIEQPVLRSGRRAEAPLRPEG